MAELLTNDPINPNIEKLHKNISNKRGDFKVPIDQFVSDLQDEEKRRRIYDGMSNIFEGFNASYEDFSSMIGFEKKSPSEPTPVESVDLGLKDSETVGRPESQLSVESITKPEDLLSPQQQDVTRRADTISDIEDAEFVQQPEPKPKNLSKAQINYAIELGLGPVRDVDMRAPIAKALGVDFDKTPEITDQDRNQVAEDIKRRADMEVDQAAVDTGQGRASSTIGTLNQSFYGLPADLLESIAVGGTSISRMVRRDKTLKTEDNPLYKAGAWYRDAIKEVAPNNPAFQSELQEQVAHSLGQLASLVLTGGVTRTASSAFSRPTGVAAQLVRGVTSPVTLQGGIQMGLPAFKEAKAMGATDQEAFETFLKNAGVGSILERIPVQKFFKRLDSVTGGGVVNLLKKGFAGGIEEGTTEVMQQLYSNYEAGQTYDKTRSLIDGMKEAGGIGFGLGFFLNAMGVSLNKRLSQVQSKKEADELTRTIELINQERKTLEEQQNKINEEIQKQEENATQERNIEQDSELQREGVDEQVQEVGEDREQPPQIEEESAQTVDRDSAEQSREEQEILTDPPDPLGILDPETGAKIYNNEAILAAEGKKTEANIIPEISEQGQIYEAVDTDNLINEAKRIVNTHSPEVVESVINNKDNDMREVLRRATGLELAKDLKAKGDIAKATEVFDKYREVGTQSAQAVQFGNVAREDPFVRTMEVTKTIRDDNKKVLSEQTPSGKSVKQEIDQGFNQVKKIARQIGVEINQDDDINKVIDKIVRAKVKPTSEEKIKVSKQKISQAKATRKKLTEEYKNRKNDLLLATAIPGLSPQGIEHAAKIAKTYIDEGVANIEILVENVKQHFKDNYGIEVSDDDLQKVSEQISFPKASDYRTNLNIWETEKRLAADAIYNKILNVPSKKEKEKTPIQEFTNRLIKNVTKTDLKKKNLKRKSILTEVGKNIEKYRDVLLLTKNQLENDGIDTSDIQDVFDLPFFDKELEKEITAQLNKLTNNIKDVVKSHYSVKEATKRSLTDALVDELGLSETDSQTLSDAVSEKFDDRMKELGQKELTRSFGTKRIPTTRQRKDKMDKLIEAINMGAFDDSFYTSLVGESYGMSSITEQDIQDLNDLADAIQTSKSKEIQNRKFREFHDKISDIEEKDREKQLLDKALELWYTNILSGFSTQSRALKGATMTSMAEAISATANNPIAVFSNLRGFTAFLRGLRRFGFQSYYQVLKDGYSDIDYFDIRPKGTKWLDRLVNQSSQGISIPKNVFKQFIRPAVLMNRFLIANDAWMKHGVKEFETYIAEYNNLLYNSDNGRTKEFWEDLNKRLAIDNEFTDQAREIVDQEIAEMEAQGEDIPSGFKNRRLQELVDEARDQEVVKNANRAANASVLMNDPEGNLGQIYRFMVQAGTVKKDDKRLAQVGKLIFRTFFPFMRVPTNFVNMNLNYTPYGFYRGIRGTTKTRTGIREFTPEEKSRHFVKASIGSIIFGSMMAAMFDWDEEKGFVLNEDAPLQVTANGPGKGYQKWALAKSVGKDYKTYSWRFKNPVTGDWSTWYSYIDNPLGMILSPVGVLSDEVRFREFQAKVKKKEHELEERKAAYLLSTAMSAASNFATEQSYVQGLERLTRIMTDENARSKEIIRSLTEPPKGMLIPNLYKQMYQQYKAYFDIPEKEAKEWYERMIKDIPMVEQLIQGDQHDQFGYPIMREFNVPLAPDFLLVPAKNLYQERETKREWELIYKYPEVTIGMPYRPPKYINGVELTQKQKSEYKRDVGLEMRRLIDQNYDSLNSYDALKLQTTLNKYRSKAVKTTKNRYKKKIRSKS